MAAPYPRWRFFPAFSPPPPWVKPLADVFAANRAQIDSFVTHAERKESDDVLRVLADDLEKKLGFTVERRKKELGKLPQGDPTQGHLPPDASARATGVSFRAA